MIDLDTLRWPDADVRGKKAIIPEAREAIPFFLQWIPPGARRGVIQAGGNVGVYPLLLAEQFEDVLTVEPDVENYDLLVENVGNHWPPTCNGIRIRNAALSDVSGNKLRLNVTEPDNCGAHQFMPPIGNEWATTTVTIDSLAAGFSGPIDLIWLDIEGAELPALKGATATIETHAPAIIVEEKGHGKLFGWSLADLHQFLGCLGYVERAQCGNDRLYTRNRP